jgi:hypothetical protein
MITPRPLEDGTPTRYAMGLGVSGEGRHLAIAHGGGINGFLSDGRYYPQEGLIVVVLQNSTGPALPGALSAALSNLILGPPPEPAATPYSGDLGELVGRYSGPARGRPMTIEVTRSADTLVFTPVGSTNALRPVHLEGLTWGSGNLRLRFVREGGAIRTLVYDQGSGIYVLRREGEG